LKKPELKILLFMGDKEKKRKRGGRDKEETGKR